MPVPKRQHSKSRTNKRAAGKHKILVLSNNCTVCKAFTQQHAVCQGCGFYKGVKILRTKDERAQERKIAKKMRENAMRSRKVASPAEARGEGTEGSEK